MSVLLEGHTLVSLGKHEEAIDNYAIAVEIKPSWVSFFNVTISYSQLGRWEELLECCKKARDFPEIKKNLIDEQIRACKCRLKKQRGRKNSCKKASGIRNAKS